MPLSTKQHSANVKVAYFIAWSNYTIELQESSSIMTSAANTDKNIFISCMSIQT